MFASSMKNYEIGTKEQRLGFQSILAMLEKNCLNCGSFMRLSFTLRIVVDLIRARKNVHSQRLLLLTMPVGT
tara:strand:- start:2466 stop:2681 length:216 start_codon:yes stop_codon:yes gene_type:complete